MNSRNKKPKRPVQFSMGGYSSEELDDPPRKPSEVVISLSQPISPQLAPTEIIIHGSKLNRGTGSSSSPQFGSLLPSPLNPAKSDSPNFEGSVEQGDGYPFPKTEGKPGNPSKPIPSILKPPTPPLELLARDGITQEQDTIQKEASRLVRNFSRKKKGKQFTNKKSILSNLLELQRHQANSGAATPREKPSKPFQLNHPKFQTTSPQEEIKQKRKSHLSPNSSYKSLTEFFGIGSSRSSISDDGTSMMTLHPERKVAAAIEDILKRQAFVRDLCKAFIIYGAPSHRLESNMARIAKVLDVEASFVSLPGLMLISFSDSETHTSETILLKVIPGYDMHRLDLVVCIYQKVCKEDLYLLDATQQLADVMERAPLYPPWAEILNYGLGSFAMAPLVFKGGWIDASVAGVLGLLVGLMTLLSRRFEGYTNVFELSAAVISAFIATVLHNHVCYWAVVLSATVNLLPGLSLTVAVMELASKNMISGAVRMFYALVIAFILGFGLSLGVRLYTSFDPTGFQEDLQCAGISPYWSFLLFPLASISFNIFLMAHPRQWPSMSFIALIGYLTSTFAPRVITSKDIVPALSGLVIGISSNVYARITNTLPIVPLLGSIIMLVPGSLGVRGSAALLTEKSAEGAGFAMQMIVIALSITVGLFFSTLVVYPMGRRRSALMTF